ncbi:MAG: 23S rRNA (pseudouridine(1915)-N(3))-methyltransferase RlmH [Clostridium sp.]|nr:23S rRNA (pseudouridine(1915)-N(3))-methyltransferase RlmH [Clostridium sp.]
MKISLTCVGKVAYPPFREAIDRYASRIVRYVPFSIDEIPDVKNTRGMTEERQKQAEGQAILSSLRPGDFLMLMDERGKEYTSRQFSKLIADKMLTLPARLVLAIGGPYGFSQEVYSRADAMMSLSKMTFPHEMARLFATEQIYRALTILKGEPYHHD